MLLTKSTYTESNIMMFNLLTVAASVHTTVDSGIQMPSREVMAAQRKAAALAARIKNATNELQGADPELFKLITVDTNGIDCSKIDSETEKGFCFMSVVEKVSLDTGLPMLF